MQPWMQYEIAKGKSFLLWIIFSHRVFHISQTLLKIAHKSRKIFHETRIALIQKSAVYTVHILVYAPLLPNKNTKRKHYYCNFFIQFIFCIVICDYLSFALQKSIRWVRGGVRATSFPRPSHNVHTFTSEPHQNAGPSIFLFCLWFAVLKHFSKIRPR